MNRSPMPPRRVALARGATPLARTTLRRRPQRPATAPRAEGWSQETREAASARSGGVCEVGGPLCEGAAVHLHHRKLRRAQDHRLVNALHCCGFEHSEIHRNPKDSKAAGWIVSQAADPATTPVLIRGRLVLLTPEGDYAPVEREAP